MKTLTVMNDESKEKFYWDDNFTHIIVEVIMGAEKIDIYNGDELVKSGITYRGREPYGYFYDCSYIVMKEDIEEWNKRKDVYDCDGKECIDIRSLATVLRRLGN